MCANTLRISRASVRESYICREEARSEVMLGGPQAGFMLQVSVQTTDRQHYTHDTALNARLWRPDKDVSVNGRERVDCGEVSA